MHVAMMCLSMFEAILKRSMNHFKMWFCALGGIQSLMLFCHPPLCLYTIKCTKRHFEMIQLILFKIKKQNLITAKNSNHMMIYDICYMLIEEEGPESFHHLFILLVECWWFCIYMTIHRKNMTIHRMKNMIKLY